MSTALMVRRMTVTKGRQNALRSGKHLYFQQHFTYQTMDLEELHRSTFRRMGKVAGSYQERSPTCLSRPKQKVRRRLWTFLNLAKVVMVREPLPERFNFRLVCLSSKSNVRSDIKIPTSTLVLLRSKKSPLDHLLYFVTRLMV